MKATKSSGNVFTDIGFDDIEAGELAAKTDLTAPLLRAIKTRKLNRSDAARLCGTDEPTLSKALSGKLDSVTIDWLTKWIVAFGGRIEIKRAAEGKAGCLSEQDAGFGWSLSC